MYAIRSYYVIDTDGLFDRNFRSTWPVRGLLTIGSPIGLKMFQKTGRDSAHDLGEGHKFLRWLNIWDPNDPVA